MEHDETLHDFLIECYEYLNQMDLDLIDFEKNPASTEVMSSIFRSIHTIKGSAGFMALSKLESVCHVGENLLSAIRDGKVVMSKEITKTLFSMSDALREILASLENKGNEGTIDYSNLIKKLTLLLTNEIIVSVEDINDKTKGKSKNKIEQIEQTDQITSGVQDSKIRVDVSLVDSMMNLVGELVLSRNQIIQFNHIKDAAFISASHKLDLVTSELQAVVMKTRLQPIINIWNKLPRVVYELSETSGKKINFIMEGKDTELDRTIIESIKDPLMHLIRNSVDHGVELPKDRKAANKPDTATIRLSAFHEGGQVNISVFDDGKGISPEKVKQKAVLENIITAEEAAVMGNNEALYLIFKSGLSTAKEVTNISGRGVGMDVVKTNIEKIGGSISIQSTPGKNTLINIKIPLTLAIIPALVVSFDNQKYAIPQLNLLEMVRLKGNTLNQEIEMVYDSPVYRLRGQLLPIVFLKSILENKTQHENVGNYQTNKESMNIVVLQAGIHTFGLVVDEVINTQDIVVKSLGKKLKNIPIYSGATIMGDGKVALILDIIGIANKSNLLNDRLQNQLSDTSAKKESSTEIKKQTLLILAGANNERMAIPLTNVSRLEEFKSDKMETIGAKLFHQYRGKILPVVHLYDIIEGIGSSTRKSKVNKIDADKEIYQAVVVENEMESFGIIVDRIIDIVEEEIVVKGPSTRKGVLYTFISKGQTTELLDFEKIIKTLSKEFKENTLISV